MNFTIYTNRPVLDKLGYLLLWPLFVLAYPLLILFARTENP